CRRASRHGGRRGCSKSCGIRGRSNRPSRIRPADGRCYPNGAGAGVAVAPRLWPDSTVVLIGGGPSLTAGDVGACRDRARVIAINDAHRLAPWADVLYSSDQRWWEYYQGVPEFRQAKYGIAPLSPRPEWGITVLANTGDDGIDT